MFSKIVKKESTVAVIGLGYVGLPIALAFAKKVKVIGFDINEKRVGLMKKGIDPSFELSKDDLEPRKYKRIDSALRFQRRYDPNSD